MLNVRSWNTLIISIKRKRTRYSSGLDRSFMAFTRTSLTNCDAVRPDKSLETFHNNILLPFAGSKRCHASKKKIDILLSTCLFRPWPRPWIYGGRMLLRNVGKLVTYYMPYQKTVLFIMDKGQTSNLKKVWSESYNKYGFKYSVKMEGFVC